MNAPAQETFLDAPEQAGLRTYVDDLIAANITAARIAVESGVSVARLKSWLSGKDEPDILPALAAWKAETETAGELDNGFVMTPTAQGIVRALDRARQAKGGAWRSGAGSFQQRGIALIYGASGAGKTETAEWYERRQNARRDLGNWPVVLVRCSGEESSAAKLHGAIIESMKKSGYFQQTHEKRIDAITEHIPDGGLLIFDEAQLLPLRRMDELRYFPDRCGIGIAFMGNMAGYKELVDARIGQITSRVGGALVVIEKPCEGDVDALMDSWEIRGRKLRELALMIGVQDGGLRMLSDTASAARIFSRASGKPIDADLFKAAAVSVGAWGGEA